MKHKRYNNLLAIAFSAIALLSCTSEKVKVKGYVHRMGYEHIRGGILLRAYYRFTYNEQTYEGSHRFGKLGTRYDVEDSIYVVFPKNKPEKSKPDGIFFRPQEVFIPLKAMGKSNKDAIKSYYSLREKPVLSIAESADDNEPKLIDYVYSQKKQQGVSGTGTVGVSLIISNDGGIEDVVLRRSSGDKNLDEFVRKTVLSLPKGTPGRINNGNPAKTSLLVEFKFE